jgi:hypothetical protein
MTASLAPQSHQVSWVDRSAELPETGERFEGLIPPIVAAPAFAIRKPAVAIFTLADYARAGSGAMTFLMTEWGKPFTSSGFGNCFRDQCNDAGFPQCRAHGLRKARATTLAERGATDRQLMAVFGWRARRRRRSTPRPPIARDLWRGHAP